MELLSDIIENVLWIGLGVVVGLIMGVYIIKK